MATNGDGDPWLREMCSLRPVPFYLSLNPQSSPPSSPSHLCAVIRPWLPLRSAVAIVAFGSLGPIHGSFLAGACLHHPQGRVRARAYAIIFHES